MILENTPRPSRKGYMVIRPWWTILPQELLSAGAGDNLCQRLLSLDIMEVCRTAAA